ncbi:MAG: type II toxin-antitoxin system RelE/ParE family toxin [Oscillospiraceae bacterium]|nr:type II toxin-antitoxin system RelE/ParE family toxin [Oscillospiraceae bacterium]
MVYSVHAMPKANAKFENHVEFLAQVSESAAEKLYDAFYECQKKLSENPHLYPKYESEIGMNLKYMLFSKRYRIVFKIVEDKVHIYDIQDCRQDTAQNLI